VEPSRGIATAPQFSPHLIRLVAPLVCVIFLLVGCGKKSLTKPELRAVTSEVVAAAQKIAGRKAEITIRPEMESPFPGVPRHLASDNIYLSLSDPAQIGALRQSLLSIAHKHKLTVGESASAGMIRFELAFDGRRTQMVDVVAPLPARAVQPASRAQPAPKSRGGEPKLAIIFDDLGYDRAAADSLLALNFPITISVLPHLPLSTDVAEEAHRRGDEVLLHLPMESEADGAKAEPEELRVGMNAAQVDSALEGMLSTVPFAAGVNNHQGSRATADAALMAELMPALRSRNLFFVDSRTTAATQAYQQALRAGVPAASRKVFLDDTATREAITKQLEIAARDAARDGSAIAIGHPHPATIETLEQEVPRLESRGIRLVFVSDLLR
jgi:uncharacterized protein